jgi:hypothetical protein
MECSCYFKRRYLFHPNIELKVLTISLDEIVNISIPAVRDIDGTVRNDWSELTILTRRSWVVKSLSDTSSMSV